MAAVDKLFGNKAQYYEFRTWCYKNNPEAVQFFYPWNHNDNYTHTMTLFPERIDKWMLQNCPFDYVVDQIKEQYNIFEDWQLQCFLLEEDEE